MNGAVAGQVQLNDVSLSYWEWRGDAQPVVCLPGTGLTSCMWKDLGPALAPRRVIAIDPRGHGRSERPEGGYAFQTFARDLEHFLDTVAADQVILAGHSYSASVVAHYAAHHPDRVSRLLLIDPSFFKQRSDIDYLVGSREELIARAARRPDRWESLDALLMDLHRRRIYKHWREDHLRCYGETASYTDQDGLVRMAFSGEVEAELYSGNESNLWELLPRISCPVLLLRGEKSLAMLPPLVAEAVTSIRRCTLVEVPRAGHFPPMENPSAFLDSVRTWLNAPMSES